MIEIHNTDNLLEPGFFNFEYSKAFLSEGDFDRINGVKGLGFYFKDDDYVTNKNNKGFGAAAHQQFEKIVREFSNSDKCFQLNYLKLSGFLVGEGTLIYQVILDGRNNQSLEVYGLEKDIAQLEEMVENQLDQVYYLQRMWETMKCT